MTDLLLQTKDRLLAAEIAYQKASDALNLAMTELETAKKNRSEAQKNFDSKTLKLFSRHSKCWLFRNTTLFIGSINYCS